ncbi:ATP synthase subunit I [Nitrosomonas sp. Nm132]|jgi:ATP synthase protein I|uniref:ATP synthase subunit I n=1 Tax=Nitrosomonas sp. Nm132 TaxID=1881053 RepID=UPI000883E287|nr:ATP synthase subunit I [Nitrosomonas sp. Nm132]SDH03043.1 ATP synthase protein I [Nitrosomonas sp. Nm132]
MPWIRNRSLHVVIRWQVLLTAFMALVFGWILGLHGAVSGFLGGMVSVMSSTIYALIISSHKGYTAGGAIRTALRAEAVKIIVIIASLWAVFAAYKEVNPTAFIGVFIMTVIIFSMALFVPNDSKDIK